MRLCLAYDPNDPDSIELLEPITFTTPFGSFTAPAGFRTDLASTPWQVWKWLPDLGPHTIPAVGHDWLYRTKPPGWTQKMADDAFEYLLRRAGVRLGRRRAIMRAVRAFGWRAWG
jgi:hypothetical protein